MNVQMERAMPDGFVFEKAQNVIHGAYSGLEFLIVPLIGENQFRIQLHVDVEGNRGKDGLLEFLGMLKKRHSFVQHSGYNGMNLISVHVASNEQEDKENLTILVSELSSKCQEFGIHNCCSYCRNVKPLRAAAVDGVPALICDDCRVKLVSGESVTQAKRENVPLGIIGAILGVLLGSALWILIGQLGFIAGIAGFAIVFCGMKGYDLLGKRLSKVGIVVCVLLSILMILGAEVASLGFVIYKELSEYGTLTMADAFSLIPELMKESEVAAGVAKDLLVGYALAIWASYASIKSAWKQVGEDNQPKDHTVVPF